LIYLIFIGVGGGAGAGQLAPHKLRNYSVKTFVKLSYSQSWVHNNRNNCRSAGMTIVIADGWRVLIKSNRI